MFRGKPGQSAHRGNKGVCPPSQSACSWGGIRPPGQPALWEAPGQSAQLEGAHVANPQRKGSVGQSAPRGTCLLGQSTLMCFWSPGQSAQGARLSVWPISMGGITDIWPINTQGILPAWPISTHGLLHIRPISTCCFLYIRPISAREPPTWPISTCSILNLWPISRHSLLAHLANQHMRFPRHLANQHKQGSCLAGQSATRGSCTSGQ